ncbi:MAG: NAD(P)H-hydrate epimerase, partial [Rhodospirillales bacterium]|nr:NAD(P)H-hydrate epimerase [Rhodospirillales bacterium]
MWRQTLLTAKEMARADALARAAGIAPLVLMENAGGAVVRNIHRRFPPQPVAVLCGPGNNGGDGFVVARLLKDMGWPVRVALFGSRDALKGDAATNAARWSGEVSALAPSILDGATLIVDALFGAGLTRALDGGAAATVRALVERKVPCIAVDIPSGVDSDTGAIRGPAPMACMTVTFFRRKPGHLLYPGRAHCGEVMIEDIGIPDSVLNDIRPETFANDPVLWLDALPSPAWDTNKYRRGNPVIVGGAIMTGAARLAAAGARRMGAGLVIIAAPANAFAVYAAGAPGVVVAPLGAGRKGDADFRKLIGDARRNAVLVGPGNGTGPATRRRGLAALKTRRAVVLDADALTSFAGRRRELFAAIRGPCVLTPHDGEFARLFGIVGDKLSRARAAAKASGATLLLKGPDTVVAAASGRAVLNGNAPPTLATAGSGDVL